MKEYQGTGASLRVANPRNLIATTAIGIFIGIAPLQAAETDRREAASPAQPEVVTEDGGAVALPTLEVSGEAAAEQKGYEVKRTRSATKTDTALIDTPQAISVVTDQVAKDQQMQGMADVVRYMPGVGMAQGEGNRDTPIIRGNTSTSDLFVDGMRDDVEYFRDLYNMERVEALKGPNAMIFGRGGGGGVLNRVTKEANGQTIRELDLTGGSWGKKRVTADIGQAVTDSVAVRLTGLYENSDSYRDGFGLERWALNPTLQFHLDGSTTIGVGYEHFSDDRTADRGISSFNGRPIGTDASTFFGNPDLSNTTAEVDALTVSVEHDFANGINIRNRTRFAVYDKFYQNVFPGAASADGSMVAISAYNNRTRRENFFNQTDVTIPFSTGSIQHTVLTGMELGRQHTKNHRETGYFTSIGPNVTSITVPTANPTTSIPVSFRQSATDADNTGTALIGALYIQDQIELTPQWQVIAGLRYDNFNMDFRNNRTGADIETNDNALSPRVGLVFKPVDNVALYSSYSVSFLPRSGSQLSSLSPSNRALDPEEFRNYEVGAKWDVLPELSLSAALFKLERSNVAIADPSDPTQSILVDGQEVRGLELGVTGQITEAWSVIGGYAYQLGEITATQSATAQKGATLGQLPKHSFSLWNKYDLNETWGVGVGLIHRSDMYTTASNAVTLPGFTRVDAAIYYSITENVRAQLNIENLFNTDYYASAHNDNNIMPGSPLAAYAGITVKF